ncbi:MAG TPA: glycosyltransferase family 4 protein [Thermoanaerobaculia bacterium]|nr:glycosyltransferase family 4 protein [Thermoanaerobaculia bacterium]
MKLLLVTNTYPPRDISGVGALVYELAREAERRGHDVRVLTRGADAGNDAVVLGVGGPKGLFPLSAAATYLRTFAVQPPTIVHVHESDGALLALALRAARAFGRPQGSARLVATLQVSYREERRAVRAVRANERVVSRPALSERLFAWMRAPILAGLGRLTASLADAVIAPSRATARELERDYGCSVREVIPNGVLSAARPPEPGAKSIGAQSTVLYVGRLRTRKAVAVLLDAFAIVASGRPDLRLVVVGDGEQERALRRRAGRPDLRGRVEFQGRLSRDAIADLYHRAAVLCLPSIYEGFPVTIVEAMSAGLPVVATVVAGVPEAVEDGVTGALVAAEDARALGAALERLLEDIDLRRRMGQRAREVFERRFAIDVVADAHLALYEELTRTERRVVQRVSW